MRKTPCTTNQTRDIFWNSEVGTIERSAYQERALLDRERKGAAREHQHCQHVHVRPEKVLGE